MVNRSFAEKLMQRVLEHQMAKLDNLFRETGRHIDVIKMADDLGAQDAPLISPRLYRDAIKPFHKALVSFIKERCDAKVLFHSDGAIRPFIEDLIEVGVDVLNPIQVTAAGMEPQTLKREFGDRICFWGGIDTHTVLPHGSKADVEREVKTRIDQLAPGGGFILAPVHNIQPDVPPENICTMYQTALTYRQSE
jgi:uroporphyrinogen decarboxylase